MSVLNYLTEKASNGVMSAAEKSSVDASITALQSRLMSFFSENEISRHFRFGSSTRGTILPRAMDEQSDIDYMVVFSDSKYEPQTYINWLKDFAEKKYARSQMYQSHPTIVLELSHIKFDLVPAIKNWYGGLEIPSRSGWIGTNPNDVNETLENKNKSNYSLIKPTIRLFKYWNAKAGYPFQSFESEKWITGLSYWGCRNQTDYMFNVFESLTTSTSYANWINEEMLRAKKIIAQSKQFERNNMPIRAEQEVKRLFRE